MCYRDPRRTGAGDSNAVAGRPMQNDPLWKQPVIRRVGTHDDGGIDPRPRRSPDDRYAQPWIHRGFDIRTSQANLNSAGSR
jgi:hypothetical protein